MDSSPYLIKSDGTLNDYRDHRVLDPTLNERDTLIRLAFEHRLARTFFQFLVLVGLGVVAPGSASTVTSTSAPFFSPTLSPCLSVKVLSILIAGDSGGFRIADLEYRQ